jgi:hypothetical protein
MNRGRRSEAIFSNHNDYEIFLALLQNATELWGGKENEPRNVAIYLCRSLRNDTLIELSQKFGMSGYNPAGSAVERVAKKMIKTPNLRKQIDKIKKSLFP